MNDNPNGCYNRPPFVTGYTAPDGYSTIKIDGTDHRLPTFKTVEMRNTTECQYSASTFDVKCVGCVHSRQSPAPTTSKYTKKDYDSAVQAHWGMALGLSPAEVRTITSELERLSTKRGKS